MLEGVVGRNGGKGGWKEVKGGGGRGSNFRPPKRRIYLEEKKIGGGA